jgi:hypothetical protein
MQKDNQHTYDPMELEHTMSTTNNRQLGHLQPLKWGISWSQMGLPSQISSQTLPKV